MRIEKQGKVIKITDPKAEEKLAQRAELDLRRKDKKITLEDIYDQQQLMLTELSVVRKRLQNG